MVQRKTIEAHNIFQNFILLSTNIKCIFFTKSIKIGAANTISSCCWLFKNLLLLFVNSTTYFQKLFFNKNHAWGCLYCDLWTAKYHTPVFLIQGGGCVLVGTVGNVNIELDPTKRVNFSSILLLSHLKNPREIIYKVFWQKLFYSISGPLWRSET